MLPNVAFFGDEQCGRSSILRRLIHKEKTSKIIDCIYEIHEFTCQPMAFNITDFNYKIHPLLAKQMSFSKVLVFFFRNNAVSFYDILKSLDFYENCCKNENTVSLLFVTNKESPDEKVCDYIKNKVSDIPADLVEVCLQDLPSIHKFFELLVTRLESKC